MKKLILLLTLIIVGCNSDYEKKHVNQKNYTLDLSHTQFDIAEYTIDGCQYLGKIGGDNRSNYLTHKGNCNNPIHYSK